MFISWSGRKVVFLPRHKEKETAMLKIALRLVIALLLLLISSPVI